MKVRIVNYDTQAWILVKFARKLHEHLMDLNVDVELSQEPSRIADINHHIIYLNYDGRRYSTDTLMFTHFVFPWEMELARAQLRNAAMAFCMSEQTVSRLAGEGFPCHKLAVAHPGHDGLIRPRPLLLGLTTRLYQDGRKREHLLKDVAVHISPDDFRFQIMGDGWTDIVRHLRQRGFQVDYWSHFDYDRYCQLMPALDYYLYLGQDEGSMGFLDALAAGVPTIVTPQGFHLDIPNGITHPVETLDDLILILRKIAQDHRHRNNLVAAWTWENYARQHLRVWTELLTRREHISEPGEDPDVVRHVRAIGREHLSESLPQRIYRIAFREGPVRVGRRVLRRWMAAAR